MLVIVVDVSAGEVAVLPLTLGRSGTIIFELDESIIGLLSLSPPDCSLDSPSPFVDELPPEPTFRPSSSLVS